MLTSESIPQLGGVLEAAIYTRDLEEARRFYSDVLELDEVISAEGVFEFFRCGSTIVLIFNPDETINQPFPPPARQIPGHGTTGAGHLCFSADGIAFDRWKDRLLEKGVAIESEVTWDNGARSIYFRDPAGNSLEIAEPKLWGYA